MRKTFEAEIQQLKDELLLMGSMVEQQVLDAVEALKKRDIDTSHRVYDADAKINSKRYGHPATHGSRLAPAGLHPGSERGT